AQKRTLANAPPLVAQLHRKVESPALIGKGGAGEARRPEGRGGIIREAVALLGLTEQAGLHLRLIALGVEDGNRIGPRGNTAEHAGRLSVLDRCRHAARFASRLAEAVGGGIEPAAHGPVVVANAGHRNAQFSRRLRARPGCKRGNEDEGEKQRPHRAPPVVTGHLALSKAMPKPSSGRLISIGFLLASCTVILRSLPARMAAMSLSVSVMATKHPTLVQVWIDCRSAVPLSTLTKTGSVRLRPRGSVIIIAALLPSGAGRTRADTTNCRVSRWKACWAARQSSGLPSPPRPAPHSAGAPSGACSARADCAAAIKMVSAITTAVVPAHLPAAEAWRLAGIWEKLLDCAEMGGSAVGGPLKQPGPRFDRPCVAHGPPRAAQKHRPETAPADGFSKRSRIINAGWKHEYPRNRSSIYRAREVFHAYRHPRLSRQGRADEGE